MEETKSKIEVMQHFLDGGEIELTLKNDPHTGWKKWSISEAPVWDWAKYDYRILKSPKFRLPTKEEFKNLNKHFSRWNEETKELEVMNENGELLFFPSNGYMDGSSIEEAGNFGYCWSSTVHGCDDAYFFCFNEGVRNVNYDHQFYGFNVRLVSDTPFEGGIEFDGLYWKAENEEGYFTFEEIVEKFNM